MTTTTIAALATSPSPAGIAVIRVSGPLAKEALASVFQSKKDPVKNPRSVVFGYILDYHTREAIDSALVFFSPGPHSFTGEDVAELQFHGSPLLAQRILHTLYPHGILPAEPGEFTKRAFLNGKMDLVQAEAIADVILATDEQSLRVAGEHLKGAFSGKIKILGEELRDVLSMMEAHIDFPEEDVTPDGYKSLVSRLTVVKSQVDQFLSSYQYGQILRDGFKVLFCGRPNAGKSSLFNLLLGKKRSIVTEYAGTTRDVIEEEISIKGHRVVLCDSAGLAESTVDPVEKIGIELVEEKLSWADLVLFVVDANDTDKDSIRSRNRLLEDLFNKTRKIWMITNKIDVNPDAIGSLICDSRICPRNFYLSATAKDGASSLLEALNEEVSARTLNTADVSSIITTERHQSCLMRADKALSGALNQIAGVPLEILAVEIRTALSALEELVGKTSNEDILGRIFSKFCIGK